MKTLNISYIILKLFIGRANEFAFDVRFVRICYLVSIYLENVDVSYVRPLTFMSVQHEIATLQKGRTLT